MTLQWKDTSGTKDYSKKRTLTLKDGKQLHAEQNALNGFWYAHYDAGTVPKDISGHFTSFDELNAKVEGYLKGQEFLDEKKRGPICAPLTKEEREIKPLKGKDTTIFAAG